MKFPQSRWMKQILWGSVWRTFLRCGAERCLASGRGAAVGLWAPNLSQVLVNLDWLWSWRDYYNCLTMGWKVACPSSGIELSKALVMCWVCCLSCFNVDWCILWILNKNICWSHRLRSKMLDSRHPDSPIVAVFHVMPTDGKMALEFFSNCSARISGDWSTEPSLILDHFFETGWNSPDLSKRQ